MTQRTHTQKRCPWHLLLLALFALTLTHCSKTPTPKTKKLTNKTIVPAGALRWTEQAQLLPPQTPLVISLRPSDALVRLDQLYEWLVAQPKMYKGNSEETIQTFANVRKFIGSKWSFDPLTPKGWQSLGLDIKKQVHIGVYPLNEGTQRYLRSANMLIKQNLGDPKQPDYKDKLNKALKQPPSLYKELAALSRQSNHTNGLRILLPVLNQKRLLAQMDLLAKDLGLQTKTFTKAPSNVVRVYQHQSPTRPVFVVRLKQNTIVADLLLDGIVIKEQPPNITKRAIEITEKVGFGRPFAPKPFDRPVVSVAINQQGFAQVLEHDTIEEIVETASRQSAKTRDLKIVEGLQQTHRNLMAWSTQVPGTSGVTYDLLAGNTKHVLQLRMNSFGMRQLKTPPTPPAITSMNIEQRALGMSISTALWSGPQWRAWLGVDAPYQLKELFDDTASLSNRGTMAYWLAAPVNMALLLTNLNEIIKLTVPLDFVPLYARRKDIERIEWTTYGSLSGFVIKPKLMLLLTLKSTLDQTERDAFSATIQDSLSLLTEKISGNTSKSQVKGQPLTQGGVHTFKVPPTHHLAPFTYHFNAKGEQPRVMLGYNLTAQELSKEVQNLSTPKTTPRTMYARIEPSSVLQLLSTYNTTQFANLDLNVLAQRIGPITLEVQPRQSKGVSTLEYSLTLLNPPSLQK